MEGDDPILAGQDKGSIGTVVRQHELSIGVFDFSVIPGRQLTIDRQLVTGITTHHDTLTILMKRHFLLSQA